MKFLCGNDFGRMFHWLRLEVDPVGLEWWLMIVGLTLFALIGATLLGGKKS